MPSMRRMKIFAILVLLFVVTTLFYTASLRQQRAVDPRAAGDFYGTTRDALDRKHTEDGGVGGGGRSKDGTAGSGRDDDDEELAKAMKQRLDDAAQLAKNKANVKAPKPDPPSKIVGVGNAADGAWGEEKGIAGRKKFTAGTEEAQKPVKEETAEEHEVEVELNSILKKSPIIIFSKSYCPHSKRAKNILLNKYDINPVPYVVELDLHEMGARLQARLAEITGRKTVPNVLVNGKSIGGGDDVAALDESQTLIDTIKDMVGKRVDISLKSVEEETEKAKIPEKNGIPEKGL